MVDSGPTTTTTTTTAAAAIWPGAVVAAAEASPTATASTAGGASGQPSHKVPLKTVLQNFLNHVASLEARRVGGHGDSPAGPGDHDAYEKEFQLLKMFSDKLKSQAEFSSSEGEKEVNRKKNRYKDILPFDVTRVALTEYPGVPGSDYVNANFIKGASGSNAYIACQGPLPHTVTDFWRMVVECEVQVIVMLCNEQEAGKHKCERYWASPASCTSEGPLFDHQGTTAESAADGGAVLNKTCRFGPYEVTVLKSRSICPDFLVRTMRLRWRSSAPESPQIVDETNVDKDADKESKPDEDFDEERTVCQFHYSAWPDHGIPTQVRPLLEMVRLIRDCQASETLPVLVHCSAGCGRTGTICAIDFIWGLLRTGKLTSDFSLFDLVKEMRRQRVAMVQTVDQYILVHRAVRELFLEQLKVIDSHPYENVDQEGLPLLADNTLIHSNDGDHDEAGAMEDDNTGQHPVDGGGGSATTSGTANNNKEYETIFISSNNNKTKNCSTNGIRNGTGSPLQPPSKQSHHQSVPRTTAETAKASLVHGNAPGPEDPLAQSALSPATTAQTVAKKKLFDPPRKVCSPDKNDSGGSCSGGKNGNSGPQKFKKGNLRLIQTEDGDWKLEELPTSWDTSPAEPRLLAAATEVAGTAGPLDEEDLSNGVDGVAGEVVHQPDPVAINVGEELVVRPFRRKGSSSNNMAPEGSAKTSASELLLRRPSIKKLRAFFNGGKDNGGAATKEPSPTEDARPTKPSSHPEDKESSSHREAAELANPRIHGSASKPQSSSRSTPSGTLDRGKSFDDINYFGYGRGGAVVDIGDLSSRFRRKDSHPGVTNPSTTPRTPPRPQLPIKRSKSMRLDLLVQQQQQGPVGLTLAPSSAKSHNFRNNKSFDQSEDVSFPTTSINLTPNPLPKPRRTNSDFSDYANIPFVRAAQEAKGHLGAVVGVHARQGGGEAVAVAGRAEVLASFQAAEHEGDRLLGSKARVVTSLGKPLSTSGNDLALVFGSESCSSGSRSSSSSSSSSRTRSKGNNSGGIRISSSNSGSGNNSNSSSSNGGSPVNSYDKYKSSEVRDQRSSFLKATDTRDLSKSSPQDNHHHVVAAVSSKAPIYANVTLEAQEKVRALLMSSCGENFPKMPRERRNSFREAVAGDGSSGSAEQPVVVSTSSCSQSLRSTGMQNHPDCPRMKSSHTQASKRRPYESIWFGKGGEGSYNAYNDPGGVEGDEEDEDVVDSASAGGYEPVTFRGSSASASTEPLTATGLRSVSLVSQANSRVVREVQPAPTSTKGPPPPYKLPPQVSSSSSSHASAGIYSLQGGQPACKTHHPSPSSSLLQGHASNGNKDIMRQPLRVNSSEAAWMGVRGSSAFLTCAGGDPPPSSTSSLAEDDKGHHAHYANLSYEHPKPVNARPPRKEMTKRSQSYGAMSLQGASSQSSQAVSAIDKDPAAERTSAGGRGHPGGHPGALRHPGSSSASNLLPGIDLDAVAAMMQVSSSSSGGLRESSLSSSMTAISGGASSSSAAGLGRPPLFGRSFAGILSGAAANIKSRFSQHVSSSQQQQQPATTTGQQGQDHVRAASQSPPPPNNMQSPVTRLAAHKGLVQAYSSASSSPARTGGHQQQHGLPIRQHQLGSSMGIQPGGPGAAVNPHQPQTLRPQQPRAEAPFAGASGGEQVSPSALPLTVPGAAPPNSSPVSRGPPGASSFQTHPFSYPNRLEAKPGGPRDPPATFQRKQEYL